jgi:hypothetical protein
MGVKINMSGVAEEVNKSVSGGKKVDVMAIDAAEKAKIGAGKFIDNPENAARMAGTSSKDTKISSESITGPQDAVVPPESSQVVSGPLMGMSKGVAQQFDSNVPQDGVEKQGIVAKFDGSTVEKGIPASKGVPQQTDEGKDGV